ncbi:MAG TPA: trypsin-like peptidase domain-containing protein [Gemmatimonadaceae bacterium]
MSFSFASGLNEDLARIAASLRRCTVLVETGGRTRGHGSGIIWSTDGLLVTNAHVAQAGTAAVTLADGTTTTARLVARDPRRDLALLRVGADLLTGDAAVIGDPSTLRTGDVVLALGHPLGVPHALALGVVHTVTHSAKAPYVAADIRLAPGNSGGPLADAKGRVVGVNCMVIGGLGVAVSVDAVRRLVAAVRAKRAA